MAITTNPYSTIPENWTGSTAGSNLLSAIAYNGTSYTIKDARAREVILSNENQIKNLWDAVKGGIVYKGITTSTLSDGLTANTVTVKTGTSSTSTLTAADGDMVIVNDVSGNIEYVYANGVWQRLGSPSGLGALAFKNSASGSYKPAGTVAVELTKGTESTDLTNLDLTMNELTSTGTASVTATTITGNFAGNTNNITASFAGTQATISAELSAPSFTYTPVLSGEVDTISATFTATNSITAKDLSFTATNSCDVTPTFTGATSSLTATLAGSDISVEATFTGTEGTASGKFTPAGTVTAPTITTTPSTTSACTSAHYANEILELVFNPVISSMTLTASAPTFTGTQGDVTATYTPSGTVSTEKFNPKDSLTATVAVTPTGTISKVSYTPAGKVHLDAYTPTGTVAGTVVPTGTIDGFTYTPTGKVSTTYTPAGTVTGTVKPTGTVTVTAAPAQTVNLSVKGTPTKKTLTGKATVNTYSVKSATFTGTEATITVS